MSNSTVLICISLMMKVSTVVGRRTLVLININDPDNPIELAFQQKYGNITTYCWFGDGYIMVGFNSGFMIAISTHIKEIGQVTAIIILTLTWLGFGFAQLANCNE